MDRFFDPVAGDLISRVVAFIREYRPESGFLEAELESVGFTTALYNLFQQFKIAVDQFMTTTTNPEIMQFIRQTEQRVAADLDQISKSFETMVQDALAEYNATLQDQGLNPMAAKTNGHMAGWTRPDVAGVKSMSGATLPPAAAVMHYSGRIKSDAVVRYGAYSLVRLFRKIFKKTATSKNAEGQKALTEGMRRMKRETERSIKAHFQDYQEGLKFQYLFKFIKGYADVIHDSLISGFVAHQADLSNIAEIMGDQRSDRQKTTEVLDEMMSEAAQVAERIDALTGHLTGGLPDGDQTDQNHSRH